MSEVKASRAGAAPLRTSAAEGGADASAKVRPPPSPSNGLEGGDLGLKKFLHIDGPHDDDTASTWSTSTGGLWSAADDLSIPSKASSTRSRSGGGGSGAASGGPQGRAPSRVRGRTGAFRDLYSVGPEIDRGSFSVVHEARHRADGTRHAVKIVDRRSLDPKADEAVFREARTVQQLQHVQTRYKLRAGEAAAADAGFVRLVDFFVEPTTFYLVMDFMEGGPVFDRVLEKHFYTEADARVLAGKILRAVSFMHAHDVVHRDLKPQNILLCSADDDTDVRIADFGFAAVVRPGIDADGNPTRRVLKQRCGTPSYVAPEVISGGGYDQAADMWSLGVIFYFLMGGYPPFVDYESRQGMFRKIMAADYEFHESDWRGVSPSAKDFIRRLLTLNPDMRLTASDALRHPWVLAHAGAETAETAAGADTGGESKSKLMKGAGRRMLKAFRAKTPPKDHQRGASSQ